MDPNFRTLPLAGRTSFFVSSANLYKVGLLGRFHYQRPREILLGSALLPVDKPDATVATSACCISRFCGMMYRSIGPKDRVYKVRFALSVAACARRSICRYGLRAAQCQCGVLHGAGGTEPVIGRHGHAPDILPSCSTCCRSRLRNRPLREKRRNLAVSPQQNCQNHAVCARNTPVRCAVEFLPPHCRRINGLSRSAGRIRLWPCN